MSLKKRGLGRGLDLLLATVPTADASNEAGATEELQNVPVDLIQRGKYQPRQDMNPTALEELANSIRVQGVIQPIIVRSIATNRYEIIAGERRWRAAQMAGIKEVPAIIRKVPDKAAIAMALIENIQRENLHAIEAAQALQRLSDEFTLTHQQVAEAVGKSRTTVTNLFRLLQLHPEVQQMLANGELEMGHARALLSLPIVEQVSIAKKVFAQGWSVREVERWIRKHQTAKPKQDKAPFKPNPNLQHFEQELSDKLGSVVSVQYDSKGKGRLTISFNTLEELEGIVSRIQ